MANAILFERDPTHRSSGDGFDDPQTLPSTATTEKLEFVFPDDILEGISEQYENNIKYIPVPNQDGVRKINIQENGLMRNEFTVNGVFSKDISASIIKLKLIRKRKQVDTFHLYGNIGLEIDNAPEFSLDPDGTSGLSIKSTTIGYAGIKTTRYDFSVTLGLGGTVA